MADFSPAQFQATIGKIEAGMSDFSNYLDKFIPTATDRANDWYIPPQVGDALIWIAKKSLEIGEDMLDWLIDLVKGVFAPIFMFKDAYDWMEVRGAANGVAGELSEQYLVVDDSDWSGSARDAYVKLAKAQATAATRVGSIATKTATYLMACAAAGAVFYLALAVVVVKLVAAAITALAAIGSAIFSWAGAGLILEEAGVNTAIIASAVGTLSAFLVACCTAMINLHGEAVDPDGFPGGKWPQANSSQYSDATVTDGHADWSLKGS
jgi:hypothetical protein